MLAALTLVEASMTHLLRGSMPLLLLAVLARGAAADVFVLANEGELRGEWLNREESPRQKYVIRTESGAEVTLQKSQVVKVVRESPVRLEYERIAPDYPDTVDGQWRLGEWCRAQRLPDLRKLHLQRVVELDPQHEAARKALGYSFVDGRWTTQEETMTERGFVRFRGRWLYPQEVALLEHEREVELAEIEWAQKLKRWREWLDGARAGEAEAGLSTIDDPYGLSAIVQVLDDEEDAHIRVLLMEALGRIGTWPALDLLIKRSLEDDVEEVRLTALDQLEQHKHPDIVESFVAKLKDKDNAVVNRAAMGLARMADPTSIRPLIEAIVTKHKYAVTTGSAGSVNPSFDSNGGGGISAGGGRKVYSHEHENEAVRDTLIKLTGVNYHYDKEDWKDWYASRRQTEILNNRRD